MSPGKAAGKSFDDLTKQTGVAVSPHLWVAARPRKNHRAEFFRAAPVSMMREKISSRREG